MNPEPQVPESGTAPAFLLSSMLVSYPDGHFSERLATLMENSEAGAYLRTLCPDSWERLMGFLQEILQEDEALRDLRSLYVEVFERARPSHAIYETEYGLGRSIAKGPELLDIATFYRAFGFTMSEDEASLEMVDHLAVELEFYALMTMKLAALALDQDQDGMEIVQNGRRRFLQDHLGSFTSSLVSRPGIMENTFYHHAMKCIDALVAAECRRHGIEQRTREWQQDVMSEEQELQCGSFGCFSGNPATRTQGKPPSCKES